MLLYFDKNISVSYRRDDNPTTVGFKMHSHDDYELYYFERGSGIYHVEGNSYPLKSGDILLMRPAEAHYIEILRDEPYERLCVNFKPELFEKIDPLNKLLIPFNDRPAGIFNRYSPSDFKSDTYKTLIANIIEGGEDVSLQTATNLLPILNELLLIFKTKSSSKNAPSIDYRIIDYVNRHICEKISIKAICDEFYISKSQLCRIFKTATASTIGEYISIKRLYKAKQLLLSGVPATKVCLQCGFNDYSAFFRAYKKRYGVSPQDTVS